MALLLIVFLIKHFICDFPLQRWPYMYLNKGIYGHPGGLLHAAIHGMGTFAILCFLNPLLALSMGCLDFAIHYHVDWAKMKLCKVYNLKPDNSEWYWHLLGFDQLIHGLTYILIVELI